MQLVKTSLLAIVMAAALSGAAVPLKAEDKQMERTVTVSAWGQVMAEPDMAHISSGVVSEAVSAREALSQNTEAMKKVVAALKAEGVDPKDIQTSAFNVEPVTVYSDKGEPPRITGYRVSNQVSVALRNLVTVGANQVHGLSFEASKAESLKDDARKEAMANALRRAKLLASAGGAEVGKVLQISEEVMSVGGPQFMPGNVRFTGKAAAAPVERGTEQLEARVTVTWELK
jgi:uncharacterized protein